MTPNLRDIRDSLKGHMAALPGIQYSIGYESLGQPKTPQAETIYRGFRDNERYVPSSINGKRRVIHQFSARITLTYKGDTENTENQALDLTQTALDYFDGHTRLGWPSIVEEVVVTSCEAAFIQAVTGSSVIYRVLTLDFDITTEELTHYA